MWQRSKYDTHWFNLCLYALLFLFHCVKCSIFDLCLESLLCNNLWSHSKVSVKLQCFLVKFLDEVVVHQRGKGGGDLHLITQSFQIKGRSNTTHRGGSYKKEKVLLVKFQNLVKCNVLGKMLEAKYLEGCVFDSPQLTVPIVWIFHISAQKLALMKGVDQVEQCISF